MIPEVNINLTVCFNLLYFLFFFHYCYNRINLIYNELIINDDKRHSQCCEYVVKDLPERMDVPRLPGRLFFFWDL